MSDQVTDAEVIDALLTQRARLKVQVGELEGVIEEVKALAVKWESDDLPDVAGSSYAYDLHEVLGWPDKTEPYDQEWRKKMYPELSSG